MEKEYSFINPQYDDIFAQEQKKEIVRIFYFGNGADLEEAKGKITERFTNSQNEDFLVFDSGDRVRVDRVITINGIPGPAYDEYDRYGLACLDCSGGME
jgi:hypothetical protein